MDWPEDTPLLRSSFGIFSQKRLNTIIPELCSEGEDLLMVKFNLFLYLKSSIHFKSINI